MKKVLNWTERWGVWKTDEEQSECVVRNMLEKELTGQREEKKTKKEISGGHAGYNIHAEKQEQAEDGVHSGERKKIFSSWLILSFNKLWDSEKY